MTTRPRGMFVARGLAAAAAGLLSLLAGCTSVAPWQRETLAKPCMNAGRDPLDKQHQEHVFFAREAASGGEGVGGGGCGCN